jgi:hypothetical protein
MNGPMPADDKPLDPETARMVAKVRRLMMIASATTFVAVGVVLAVIGYRVFKAEGSATPASAIAAALPAGARVVSTAIGDGRIALTIELGGVNEVRLFDLKTLQPLGRIVPK